MKIFIRVLLASLLGLFLMTQGAKAQESDSQTVQAKLDQVLKNQEEIVRKLEEIKNEVEIVKVRATR